MASKKKVLTAQPESAKRVLNVVTRGNYIKSKVRETDLVIVGEDGIKTLLDAIRASWAKGKEFEFNGFKVIRFKEAL